MKASAAMISSEAGTRSSPMRYTWSVLGGTPTGVRRDQKAVRLGFEASSSRGRRLTTIGHGSIRSRRLEDLGSCFPSEMMKRRVISRKSRPFGFGVFDVCVSPNKTPEPTPTSVMPRAISRVTESKRWSAESNPARVMPDVVVAHL